MAIPLVHIIDCADGIINCKFDNFFAKCNDANMQLRELRTFYNAVGQYVSTDTFEPEPKLAFCKFFETEIDAILAIQPFEELQRKLMQPDAFYSIVPVQMINIAADGEPPKWHSISIAKIETIIQPMTAHATADPITAFAIVFKRYGKTTVHKCFITRAAAENEVKIANNYKQKSEYLQVLELKLININGRYLDLNLRQFVPVRPLNEQEP